MKCQLKDRDRKMDEFVMGKMSAEEADAFEIHAFSCPDCLDEMRMREQMIGVMKEQPDLLEAKAGGKARQKRTGGIGANLASFWRNRLLYVGAAAILLLAIMLVRQLRQGAPEVDLAKFEESAYLESVLHQTFQSDAITVAIISPRIGENFKGDIPFRWRAQKDEQHFEGPFELKILDNRENMVLATTVQGSQYTLPNSLAPGLYYWTLEDQGQMLSLGKFFVDKPD